IALAVIDNFIKPLAMKHGTGLPTIALFLGILGGLEAYGPLGLFLGPAIMSVFSSLLPVYRKDCSGRRKEAACALGAHAVRPGEEFSEIRNRDRRSARTRTRDRERAAGRKGGREGRRHRSRSG